MYKDIKFSGLTISGRKAAEIRKPWGSPFMAVDPSWARLSYKIKQGPSLQDRIDSWLAANCKARYLTYTYFGATYTENHLIIRFEDVNDAVMFKLQGVVEDMQEVK